jgi:hypothetical protein
LLFWAIALTASHLLWATVEKPLRSWIVGRRPAPSAARWAWRRPAWLTAEALLLLALLTPVWRQLGAPHVTPLPLNAARALARDCPPEMRDARFGDCLMFRGVTFKRTLWGQRLEVAWQSLKEQPADLMVRVQWLGPRGEIRYRCDEQPGADAARSGALWRQLEWAPKWAVADAVAVTLSASGATESLIVDRGPTAFDGRALRLALPR